MTIPERTVDRKRPISVAIRRLMVLAAVAFAVASLIHFGNTLAAGPITIADPFPGAAIPEAIIAIALGIGAVSAIAGWPGNWGLALGTSLFALLLTIFGLTVTIGSGRIGDIIYHVIILTVLVVIVGNLLVPTESRRT
jgi:hypothetical protein